MAVIDLVGESQKQSNGSETSSDDGPAKRPSGAEARRDEGPTLRGS